MMKKQFVILWKRFLRNMAILEFAHEGDKALEMISEGRYDLVISNITMCGMDGITLLKKTREIYPLLPFIIMTGFPSALNVAGALLRGVDAFLVKPASLEVIVSTVEYVINKDRLLKNNNDSTTIVENSLVVMEMLKQQIIDNELQRLELQEKEAELDTHIRYYKKLFTCDPPGLPSNKKIRELKEKSEGFYSQLEKFHEKGVFRNTGDEGVEKVFEDFMDQVQKFSKSIYYY